MKKKCKPAADYRAARRNFWRSLIREATWESTRPERVKRFFHPPVRRNRAKRWDDADRAMMLALNPGS